MSIPANINPFLLAAAAVASPVQIERSLRFNSSDSAFLSRTPASAGNRRTWTWAGWVKRSALGGNRMLMSCQGNSDSTTAQFWFNSDQFMFGVETANLYTSTAVFRDVSAWYHVVFAFDSTNATSADRMILYVNGTRQVASTYTAPTLNADYGINRTVEHNIGRRVNNTDFYFDGYIADPFFIDGQALTPSSFTEVSATTGQLIPKAYSGSYGTNGFKLTFSDNSNNTATTLGKDTSGNGNNWTPNNVSVTTGTGRYIPYVSNTGTIYSGSIADMFDGSTSNLDALRIYGGTWTLTPSPTITVSSSIRVMAFNDGSGRTNTLTANSTSVNVTDQTLSWRTITLPSYPATLTSLSATAGGSTGNDGICVSAIEIDGVILTDKAIVGLGNDSLVDTPTSYGTDTGAGGEVRGNYCTLNPLILGPGASLSNGNLEASTSASDYGACRGTIGVSSGKWYFEAAKTGVGANIAVGIVDAATPVSAFIGNSSNSYSYYGYDGKKVNNSTQTTYGASYTTGDIIGVALDLDAGTLTFYKNGISQGQAFSGISGTFFPAACDDTGGAAATFALNFGQRPFAYTAPSGFKALCDTNLPAPVVAKPNTVMDVVLYSGTGSNQTITGLNFNPDFVWLKRRSSAQAHYLYDVIRGTSSVLYSDGTDAEQSISTGLTAFNSNGFSLGSLSGVNASSTTNVAWTWDAGSSTVTNTQGSITSQVRANASAGFSIVTYTGTGTANSTFGHGLGVAPALIITKNRGSANDWYIYHSSLGVSSYLSLNTTGAAGTLSNYWSPVNSTVFGQTYTSAGPNNGSQVAYCFAPVTGYSSFGSYTGNGSTDGPFVYTGFRPKFIIVKSSSFAEYWEMYDASRDTYNVASKELFANTSNAETTYAAFDFLSNGFKMRNTGTGANSSGQTYIYCAWAESPFAYARAR